MTSLRTLTLLASLAAAGLAGAGCGPVREPLEVDWTFAGKSCAQAGVETIVVGLSNEVLTPNQFTCQQNGQMTVGAALGSYLTGPYTLTVTGSDANNTAIYQGSTTVTVHSGGANLFAYDVPAIAPTSTGGGSATLRWTFGGKGCAASGVTDVRVALDGQALTDANNNADLPCSQPVNGTNVDGISVSPLSAGSHTFDISGFVGSTQKFQLTGLTVTVADGQDTSLTPDVPAATANVTTAALSWSFAGMSCAEADVTMVHVFVDPDASGNGGTDAGLVPCTNSGADGVPVSPLTPGTHTFAVSGIRHTASSDQLVYLTMHPASGPFQSGFTTAVSVVADATSPGLGGAQLSWVLPTGVPSCATQSASTTVSFTLTPPNGPAQAAQSGPFCGMGATGADFCWTGSPTHNCPGLTAGVWSISASMMVGGKLYQANDMFTVANNEHGMANIQFQ